MSTTHTRRKPSRTKTKAKGKRAATARTTTRAKPATPRRKRTAGRAAVFGPRAAAGPAVSEVLARTPARPQTEILLYNLICPKDGWLETGLSFDACEDRALAHNDEHPDHHAYCEYSGPKMPPKQS